MAASEAGESPTEVEPSGTPTPELKTVELRPATEPVQAPTSAAETPLADTPVVETPAGGDEGLSAG